MSYLLEIVCDSSHSKLILRGFEIAQGKEAGDANGGRERQTTDALSRNTGKGESRGGDAEMEVKYGEVDNGWLEEHVEDRFRSDPFH